MKMPQAIAWSLLAIATMMLGLFSIFALREMGHDPQERVTTRIFGLLALLVLAAITASLWYAQRHQSRVATWSGLTLLALPMLLWGVQRGGAFLDRVDRAHSRKLSLQFQDSDLTAMAEAIDRGDTATLRQQFAKRAPVWTARSRGDGSLLGLAIAHVMEDYASTSGLESVRLLIAAGARATAEELGPRRLLMPAVLGANTPGALELLDLVLQAGGDANAADEQGEPLVHLLAFDLPRLKMLQRHGADLRRLSHREDHRDWTVAMTAANLRDWDRVAYVLDAGVPAEHRAPDGETLASVLRRVAKREADSGSRADHRLAELLKRVGAH